MNIRTKLTIIFHEIAKKFIGVRRFIINDAPMKIKNKAITILITLLSGVLNLSLFEA
jgi:hypothetical protein